MNFAAIIAAYQEIMALLSGPYVGLAVAALAALKAGGWQGLVVYLESLLVTPPGPVPPKPAIEAAIRSLKAAHA